MASFSWNDLITFSLEEVQVVAPDSPPQPNVRDTAIRHINRVLANWNASGNFSHSQPQITHTFATSSAQLTIGPGAEIDIPVRPEWILLLQTRVSEGAPWRTVQMGDLRMWAEAGSLRDTTQAPIGMWRYEREWPVGKLHFNTRTVPGYQLTLWHYTNVTVDNLTEAIDLPPGFMEPLILSIATSMANAFGIAAGEQMVLRNRRDVALGMWQSHLGEIRDRGDHPSGMRGADWGYGQTPQQGFAP